MKTIKYQAEIKFTSNDGKEVKLSTLASSSAELLKNLTEVLEKKSKNCILRLFGF